MKNADKRMFVLIMKGIRFSLDIPIFSKITLEIGSEYATIMVEKRYSEKHHVLK